MLNSLHDTGPATTSRDSDDNEELPENEACYLYESTYSSPSNSQQTPSMRQKRRSRWRQTSDFSIHSNQSFNPRKLLLFILALVLLPVYSSGRTTSAPSFKSDPSVLATFTDTFENKDVELEKMANLNNLIFNRICIF